MRSEKRQRLYIDGSVQGTLLKRILLYWGSFLLLTMALSWSLSFVVHWFVLQMPPSTPLLLRAFWISQWTTVLAFAATLPAVIYDSLRVSHRFAGPFLRLKRAVKQLADGETVQPLHFRDGDFWQDVADDFNRVLERIQPSADRTSPAIAIAAESPAADECAPLAAH